MLMTTISDVMHPATRKGFACTCWRMGAQNPHYTWCLF